MKFEYLCEYDLDRRAQAFAALSGVVTRRVQRVIRGMAK